MPAGFFTLFAPYGLIPPPPFISYAKKGEYRYR
jgi:hypothetical protein